MTEEERCTWFLSNMTVYDRPGVCSFITNSASLGSLKYSRQACHVNVSSSSLDEVYSSLYVKDKGQSDIASTWWSFIFDKKHSPWREVVQDATIHFHQDLPLYVHIPGLRYKPGQVVVNLLIASRVPWERPDQLHIFRKMLEHGFSLAESVYICEHFKHINNEYRINVGFPHYFFDLNKTVDFYKFRDGKPTFKRFYALPNYRPCNEIWRSGDRDDSRRYEDNPFYNGLFKHDREYKGSFKKLLLSYSSINDSFRNISAALETEDKLIEVLKSRRSEWRGEQR